MKQGKHKFSNLIIDVSKQQKIKMGAKKPQQSRSFGGLNN